MRWMLALLMLIGPAFAQTPGKMVTLVLTEQEAAALRTVLDIAVKSGGMQVAAFAVVLDGKIVAAQKEEPK